jgi:hypothetical protein
MRRPRAIGVVFLEKRLRLSEITEKTAITKINRAFWGTHGHLLMHYM